MSYWPYIDYLCSSGEFGQYGKESDRHWQYKYQVLRPDFMSVEIDDPLRERKIARAQTAGIKVLTHYRLARYIPTNPRDPTLRDTGGQPISSTSLFAGTAGGPGESDWGFTFGYNRLFAVKKIRDELYGKRNWFA